MAESLQFGGRTHLRQFAVDDDENHIVSLDTTDTGILIRWEKAEKDLIDTLVQIDTLKNVDGEAESDKAVEMAHKFAEIENRARECIDYLFNTNASEHICAKYGCLIRTLDGEPFLMQVIEVLLGFYADDIKKDMEKAKKRIEKHTKKYVK